MLVLCHADCDDEGSCEFESVRGRFAGEGFSSPLA